MIIALAQINPTVGDLTGNASKIISFTRQASEQGAELVIFPELCITGYPPLDLLESEYFIDSVEAAVGALSKALPQDVGVIIGAPVRNLAATGKRLFNVALLLENGEIVASYSKQLLPTYDVFDEYRYFEPGDSCDIIEWRGVKFGLHICEDMWNNEENAAFHMYDENPVDALADQGAQIFLNLSASPFSSGKHDKRNRVIGETCREHGIPFVLVNTVGANTEIIFDGDSRVHDASGRRILCAPSFEEALLLWDTEKHYDVCPMTHSDIGDVHAALVMGLRDYFEKTGIFSKALVGLSGGIDSAVTCALATAALGPDRVVGVTMPSVYSSTGSVDDSRVLAENLGIEFHKIPIADIVEQFEVSLKPAFGGMDHDITEENIQSRSRGILLMALSNKFSHLLLATGNKSEMSVGYATLYGDMNGGLAVLSDVYKTEVYQLAEYINSLAGSDVIPRNTIEKVPSAELRPDQTDQDSLPEYSVLDTILELYIEELLDVDEIVNRTGYDQELVKKILGMVDRTEFKRRQAAPGLRVSSKAFGIGRRVPIVMRWHRNRSTINADVKDL
ncbi:MAG: NAD+ synthase [Rhodothermales bacterium]|nr:NAD+ synthase [Rhodothermales bacterium]